MRVDQEGEGNEPPAEEAQPIMTTDIVAMISPEGERVELTKGLKARGNVEDWLRKVEDAMFISLKKGMKKSITDYINNKREVWVKRHPNQIILTVSQIMWARDVHGILDKHDTLQDDMIKFERSGNAVNTGYFFNQNLVTRTPYVAGIKHVSWTDKN